MGGSVALVVAGALVLLLDVVVRWLHGWYREAALGAGRRARLPPGEMGWPVVGAMWSFLRAFKSGTPDAFIGSYNRRSVTNDLSSFPSIPHESPNSRRLKWNGEPPASHRRLVRVRVNRAASNVRTHLFYLAGQEPSSYTCLYCTC
jgi:hypothetical protein